MFCSSCRIVKHFTNVHECFGDGLALTCSDDGSEQIYACRFTYNGRGSNNGRCRGNGSSGNRRQADKWSAAQTTSCKQHAWTRNQFPYNTAYCLTDLVNYTAYNNSIRFWFYISRNKYIKKYKHFLHRFRLQSIRWNINRNSYNFINSRLSLRRLSRGYLHCFVSLQLICTNETDAVRYVFAN